MFKFIGKALSNLLLTDEAKKAVSRHAPATPQKGKSVDAGMRPAVTEAQQAVQAVMTPERAELIRRAMQTRAAKQKLLDTLNDESRAQLVATTILAFLDEEPEKPQKK